MKILGISGKRESGKSTLAKCLQKYGFERASLADPLKDMCKKLYGLTEEQVRGKSKEEPTEYRRIDGSYYTPRDILIREGCLKRSINPNFWCEKLEVLLGVTLDLQQKDWKDALIVIDDIRFLNEINYFKAMGAKFIRLERSQEAIGKAALDDLSETELDTYKDWDFILLEKFNRNIKDLETFSEYIAAHL